MSVVGGVSLLNSKKKNEIEQLNLFDFDELARTNMLDRVALERLPDHPVTEIEARIINNVKSQVQDICKSDPTVDSIKITINPATLSENRKINNLAEYKNNIFKTVKKIQESKKLPGETIRFKGTDGHTKTLTFTIFDRILSDDETKEIVVDVSPHYIDYVKKYVLPNPEVRLLKTFRNKLNTRYSNHFVDFLNDRIGGLRKEYGPQEVYEVEIDKEKIKKFIPTEAGYDDYKYVLRVLTPAIADVNNQDESPYIIDNPDNFVIKKGRKHDKYRFIVRMKSDKTSQPMFININNSDNILDNNLVPNSWTYLDFVMTTLHVDKSFRLRAKAENDRMRTWKTYLSVAVQDKEKRNGGYFNKAYSEYWASPTPVTVLINNFREIRPELCDEVIAEAMRIIDGK